MDNEVRFIYEGINLRALNLVPISFMYQYTYSTFPDNFCGAGKGLGEKLVPDYIMKFTKFLKWIGCDISLKISPACYIHDKDYEVSTPEWTEFYEANERLRDNIESIINYKIKNEYIRSIYHYRATTYMNAVNIVGRSVFWTLKASEGYNIPEDAKGFVDLEEVNKFKN